MIIENLRRLLSITGFLSAVKAVTECLMQPKNADSRWGSGGIDDNYSCSKTEDTKKIAGS